MPGAARQRESFGIRCRPKNPAQTRRGRERDLPVWVKVAAELDIRLDQAPRTDCGRS